ANKTTIRFDATTVEFGAFGVDRHLMHPIFQWLDYRYKDYGGFARATDDRLIGGFRNRLVAGVNVVNGTIDNQQFANVGGNKGALISSSIDKSKNTSVYIEDSFYFLPNVAAIGGTQFLYATRDRQARFGSTSGSTEFNLWSPKGGLLWDIDPTWQAFANISRSAEVPSFGESSAGPGIPFIPFTSIRPQRATTYEIGTRGRRPDLTWELTGYRANIRDELLCLYSAFGNCNVTNANRSVHQGIEAGLGIALFKNIFAQGAQADKIWINAAYTLNDFRFDNDAIFGNNQLPGAPRHYLRAEMLYKHANGFYIGPNVEWVPQAYYVDSANTVSTQAYAIFGLKAGIDDGKYSMYLEARNIANTAYIASSSIIDKATAASPLFEPGTGRAVYAGVKVRW
ncbi:MAG: TonB-dependent receptor, partial [Pseudomonadota bacterium]